MCALEIANSVDLRITWIARETPPPQPTLFSLPPGRNGLKSHRCHAAAICSFFWEERGDLLLPGELQRLFSGEAMSTALGTQ